MKTLVRTISITAAALLLGGMAQEALAGGSITGAVTFSGNPPKNLKMVVAKNADFCGSEIEVPLLVVNPQNKGVQFTVVYLEGEGLDTGGAKKNAVLRMGQPDRKCDFVERVVAVQKLGDLSMKNLDPILHNPHSFTPKHATFFNISLSEQGMEVSKKIRADGVYRLQCDSHVHMNGWIVSVPHSYFAVTDKDGNFKIEDIPPGKYKLVAWHENWTVKNWEEVEGSRKKAEAAVKAGTIKMDDAQLERPLFADPIVLTKEIEVKDGGAVKVNFELR